MKKKLEPTPPFVIKPSALLIFEKRSDDDSHAEEEQYQKLLSNALCAHFYRAPIVSSVEEIWEELFKEIPSVIVIEQTMRSVDALSLIKSLRSSKFCFDIRYFFCCGKLNESIKSICSYNCIDGAFSYGDDPVTVAESIFGRYTELTSTSRDRRLSSLSLMINDTFYLSDNVTVWELGSRITDALLVPLGFKAHHKGTKYLELVICLRVFGVDTDLSDLYRHTAECYFTTPTAVEKAIRYSIERAWSGSSPYMQYRMFGNSVDPERGKPTASEFVETIVRHTIERLSREIDYSNY